MQIHVAEQTADNNFRMKNKNAVTDNRCRDAKPQKTTGEDTCRHQLQRTNAENNCTEQLQKKTAENSCRDQLQRKVAVKLSLFGVELFAATPWK